MKRYTLIGIMLASILLTLSFGVALAAKENMTMPDNMTMLVNKMMSMNMPMSMLMDMPMNRTKEMTNAGMNILILQNVTLNIITMQNVTLLPSNA